MFSFSSGMCLETSDPSIFSMGSITIRFAGLRCPALVSIRFPFRWPFSLVLERSFRLLSQIHPMGTKPHYPLPAHPAFLISMKTRSASRSTSRRGGKTSRRQLINTGKSKQYVRRYSSGQFKKSVKVARSLAADRRSKSNTKVKKGQGDRGDQ